MPALLNWKSNWQDSRSPNLGQVAHQAVTNKPHFLLTPWKARYRRWTDWPSPSFTDALDFHKSDLFRVGHNHVGLGTYSTMQIAPQAPRKRRCPYRAPRTS